MIFSEPPKDFQPRRPVVGCWVVHDGKFVLLHRPLHKSHGGKWGVPAGKMELGETEVQAMVRELFEETGIQVAEEDLQFFRKVYVRYADSDFAYVMFSLALANAPVIQIRDGEHDAYQWVTPENATDLPLMHDLEECIDMFFPKKKFY
ncbi:MAG: NUDIX hydrolase [Patescibacteria group bacterium]|jgi:8-oxo-dGTP pyrophosphatase MutT (NUDIX family)